MSSEMYSKICQLLVLLLIALPVSTMAETPEHVHIKGVLYDIGADRPVSNTAFEIVSYSTCDSDDEIFRTPVHTGEKGEFEASLPVGSRDLRIAVPSELKPIRACIQISSREQIATCSTRLRMAPPFREQGLIVGTASVSSKYPPDIRSEHPCAQGFTGVCGALSLANKILSKRLAWLDEEDRPIANVKLEFHSHSMGPGELFGSGRHRC